MIWVVSLSATNLITRSLTAVHHVFGIRSLIGVGKLVGPLAHSVLYPRYTNTTLPLKAFRREPDISEFDWPFTPNHSSSPQLFNAGGFGPPVRVTGTFNLAMARSLGFGSAACYCTPYSDSLSLRLRSFHWLNLATYEQLAGSLCKRHAVTPTRRRAPTACRHGFRFYFTLR